VPTLHWDYVLPNSHSQHVHLADNNSLFPVFEQQIRQNAQHQAFVDDLTVWSITIPHYTSAKLLNASGFDDLQTSGEFSPWTLRQRSISIRLLRDALENDEVHMPATIAAVQGFTCL
jgi:hypothetical protein